MLSAQKDFASEHDSQTSEKLAKICRELSEESSSLQFYKQKRQAIYKANDICPSTVKISVNLQFLNSKEMIIIRIIKVDYNGLLFFRLSVWFLNSHRNTVTDHEILLFVDLKQ